MRIFNVLDYGAKGDGLGKDTAAIQKTIDGCNIEGGGTVFFPPGVYLSGTLYLKDNICLEISPGATLRGSTEPGDYNPDDFCPQNRSSVGEKASGAHLVVAVECKNITICGGGRIDGSGPSFFNVSRNNPNRWEVRDWRPSQMLFICECENVRIRDIELFNSPYWTCFLLGCERVFVSGVRIWNDRHTVCGDGIDIDCSRQVIVSDCLVESGDDCITLRASDRRLKFPKPCEDIVVTNCIFKTRANGVRVGVGSGLIRNALFSNLVIGGHPEDEGIKELDCRGICIQSNYCYPGNMDLDHSGRGAEISEIGFDNIVMVSVQAAIYVSPGYAGGKPISNLRFHNIRGFAQKGSSIRGSQETPLRNIVLSQVSMKTSGREDKILPPEKWGRPVFEWDGCMPAALYVSDCENVNLDHCSFDWGETGGYWLHAFWGERIDGFGMKECRMKPPPGSSEPVRLNRVKKAGLYE